MKNDPDQPRTVRPRFTPLSIIAMFLSLAEIVVGTAATFTEAGGLRTALVGFVIAFPVLVAVAFFYILWHRPYVFYPPHEYGPKTDVTKFVDAMRHRSSKEAAFLDGLFESLLRVLESPENSGQAVLQGDAANRVASRMAETIREHFVILEAGPEFGSRAGRYSIPYHANDPVWRVGNEIYFLLEPEIEPFTLGTKWVLIDASTQERMTSMESAWARGETDERDVRPVADAGVQPGMVLQAVFLPGAGDAISR
jgi:hypothetical protein